MLEVRYSTGEAIDISGSWEDVESFRQEILRFLKTDSEKIQIEIEKNINSEPWNYIAKNLEIVQNDLPVEISISTDRVIKIKGSKANLEKFTSFLIFDEKAVSGSHSHYEYYEGNEWISPESFPLIIEIK